MPVTGNNKFRAYSLSIRLRADGFSFYAHNTTDFTFFQKEDYQVRENDTLSVALQRALTFSPLLKKSYQDVHVIVDSPTAHIPLDFFQKDDVEPFFQLTCSTYNSKTDTTFYNILPQQEIVEVGMIKKDIQNILSECFPSLTLHSINAQLLDAFGQTNTKSTQGKKRLFAYFHEQEMFLCHYEGNKLMFANAYATEPHQNISYYILYVWKTLGLQPLKDEFVFVDSTGKAEAIRNVLSPYLLHITYFKPEHYNRDLPRTILKDTPFDLITLLYQHD